MGPHCSRWLRLVFLRLQGDFAFNDDCMVSPGCLVQPMVTSCHCPKNKQYAIGHPASRPRAPVNPMTRVGGSHFQPAIIHTPYSSPLESHQLRRFRRVSRLGGQRIGTMGKTFSHAHLARETILYRILAVTDLRPQLGGAGSQRIQFQVIESNAGLEICFSGITSSNALTKVDCRMQAENIFVGVR